MHRRLGTNMSFYFERENANHKGENAPIGTPTTPADTFLSHTSHCQRKEALLGHFALIFIIRQIASWSMVRILS